MSESRGLKQLVADEVSEQLDVTDLLDGGSLEDGLDGSEIGASVGRQFGERVGYELGTAIGREVHEAIAEGVEEEKDLGEIRSELISAIQDAFGETVEELEVADSLGLTDEEGAVAEEETDDAEDADGDEEDVAEGDADGEETADEEETEAADDEETEVADEEETDAVDEEETDAADDQEEDEPSAADLEGLRRETLEEFLSIMSYSDLQSVAKDVGVKANLSRKEMTERIVETVSESDDELAAAANEEGS